MFKKSNSTDILAHIATAVGREDFDSALTHYLELFTIEPDFLSPQTGEIMTNSRTTHIHNAANLARRALFVATENVGSTDRIKKAVHMLVGKTPRQYDRVTQRPSFFFVPDLPSSPFSKADSVEGLNDFIEALTSYKDLFVSCIADASDNYVHEIGQLPNTSDWKLLSENWNSMHLMKGGKFTRDAGRLPQKVKALFESPLLAYCPSHSPEVVLSVLKPNTTIPPHYGVSNIKWTLHVPLIINEKSYLEVAGDRRYWHEGAKALLFDDSFVHSAENAADNLRAVLIIDIWNPNLTYSERQDIEMLMKRYSDWSAIYGEMAVLDRRLNK